MNLLDPVAISTLRPAHRMDLLQIDHTPVDVIVVDQEKRLPIGRPWLTLAIAVKTRMILAGTYREQRILLNSIRFLANDLRLPLVCAGTHEAKQALMTDQQLADRFEAAELPAWENDASFQQLLLSFESILPLRCPSEFRDPKVHQLILSLSEGVLVRICRIIESAATESIHSGQEYISLGLLKDDLVTGSLVSIADRRSRRVSGR